MTYETVDPIENSIEPLAELLLDYTTLSPKQATAVAAGILEFAKTADAYQEE
jgi:hypothetical protein